MASNRRKRKQAEKEEKELTRKEVRQRASDSERNQKLVRWVGLAVGLALLAIIIGLVIEFLVMPNSAVATIGDQTIITKDYRKRVNLERDQIFRQLRQYVQLEEQFGGQGYFTNQINQLQSMLGSPETLGFQVLNNLINEKVLLKAAEERGITVSDDEVNEVLREEIAAIQQAVTEPQATQTAEAGADATATASAWTPTPLPSVAITGTEVLSPTATPPPTATPLPVLDDELYNDGLDTLTQNLRDSTGLSIDEYREVIRAQLIEEQIREQVGAEEVIDTEEQVNARHILLSPRDPTPEPTPIPADVTPEPTIEPTEVPEDAPDPTATPAPRSREETLVEIQELRRRIVEDGEDFATLAIEYSDDTGSGMAGGDLDWFGRGRMVPPFDEAAFGLEIGDVSEPISTTFGYHIIEVLDKDTSRPKDEGQLDQERTSAYDLWLQTQISEIEIDRPESITDKLPANVRRGVMPQLQAPAEQEQ